MGGIASNFVGRDVIILSYAIPLLRFVPISSLLVFPFFFFYSTSFTLGVLFFLCFFFSFLFFFYFPLFSSTLSIIQYQEFRLVQSTMITYFLILIETKERKRGRKKL